MHRGGGGGGGGGVGGGGGGGGLDLDAFDALRQVSVVFDEGACAVQQLLTGEAFGGNSQKSDM